MADKKPESSSKTNGGSTLEKPVYDPTAPSAIEVEHIVKRYGDFTAVDGVSFSVKEGEIFLHHCHISPYSHGNIMNHEPLRTRKLLLHRKEINKLLGKTQQQGLTLIPLRIYFSKRGLAKVELGLAKGKKQHDRRESIKTREASREVERAMKDKR